MHSVELITNLAIGKKQCSKLQQKALLLAKLAIDQVVEEVEESAKPCNACLAKVISSEALHLVLLQCSATTENRKNFEKLKSPAPYTSPDCKN